MRVTLGSVDEDNYQRKLALSAFFSNPVFKEFVEGLESMKAYSDSEVDRKISKAVGLEDLSKLNFEVGERSGLAKALSLLSSLREDLEVPSPDEA